MLLSLAEEDTMICGGNAVSVKLIGGMGTIEKIGSRKAIVPKLT